MVNRPLSLCQSVHLLKTNIPDMIICYAQNKEIALVKFMTKPFYIKVEDIVRIDDRPDAELYYILKIFKVRANLDIFGDLTLEMQITFDHNTAYYRAINYLIAKRKFSRLLNIEVDKQTYDFCRYGLTSLTFVGKKEYIK